MEIKHNGISISLTKEEAQMLADLMGGLSLADVVDMDVSEEHAIFSKELYDLLDGD